MSAATLICTLLAGALSVPAMAADAHRPHPHRGILAPYDGLPEIVLDDDQRSQLTDGRIVIITVADAESGGRGVAVIDIAAPPDTVWSRIMGFEHYAEWVGPVKRCKVYARKGQDIYTDTKVAGFLYKYEYFLINTYEPDRSLMTWTQDYDRYSDFDDCVGCWFVEPHPRQKGWSRAWFSSDLALRAPLPEFVMNFVKKQGLKDATSWVRRESEAAMGGPDTGEDEGRTFEESGFE